MLHGLVFPISIFYISSSYIGLIGKRELAKKVDVSRMPKDATISTMTQLTFVAGNREKSMSFIKCNQSLVSCNIDGRCYYGHLRQVHQ